MEGLGKDFNVVAVADGVRLNLQDYEGVTFIGINAAGDTWTIEEHDAQQSGNTEDLVVIDHSYVQETGAGADAWVKLTQAAAATEVTTSSQDVVALYVSATQLSDGFKYVSCTATGAGIVIAILHGLAVQRTPENLPKVSV